LSTQRFSDDSLTPMATATSRGEKNWLTTISHNKRHCSRNEVCKLEKTEVSAKVLGPTSTLAKTRHSISTRFLKLLLQRPQNVHPQPLSRKKSVKTVDFCRLQSASRHVPIS
ncbi:MAG: hypothetical protein ACKPHU_28645, partial [Planctomycetaceae bacterium]